MDESKPKTANWEPGTLDKTRQAIGNIDKEEAIKMTKILGGEIMYEKSDSTMPSRASSSKGAIIRNPPPSSSAQSKTNETSSEDASPSVVKNQESLIEISAKVNSQVDKLMMSNEFQIKPNYGPFNFIKYFMQNGREQVITDFCISTLKTNIDVLQNFITNIKTIIQISPSTYKTKIAKKNDAKFRLLRMVADWSIQQVKLAYIDLINLPSPYTVANLLPYTRQLFRLVIQLYYYGETKVSKLIKEIYADECVYPDAPRTKLSELSKDSITDWLYIQEGIIKRMYPLLMRMCSTTFEYYPEFYRAKVSDILKFVGLHKYDLLLADKEKPKTDATSETPNSNENNSSEENNENPETSKKPELIRGVKDSYVTTGISLLEQLFPQAGFNELEKHPDLYPYFQPLYRFEDGFNVLNPENPIQITVVLMRIIEDFFKGCRNIQFVQTEETNSKDGADSMNKILDDWIGYREIIFEKLYCEPLNDLVNQSYSQIDFEKTQFGKKLLTSLLWQTNYHFLPSFQFDRLLLERPSDESPLPPLYKRTDFARKFLTSVVIQCDAMSSTKGTVSLVKNPWNHYKFDVQNEVSKRVDILLGARNKTENTNATNANLLKYTLCVVSVLDWWLNNPESPAYSTSPTHIYRISTEDGKPQFSTKQRSDQNRLFAEQIRAAYKNTEKQKME